MNKAAYNASGKAARVLIDVIDLTRDDEGDMTEVPAKRRPFTPRKRQGAAAVSGRPTKKINGVSSLTICSVEKGSHMALLQD
jgi:hypothetical protein